MYVECPCSTPHILARLQDSFDAASIQEQAPAVEEWCAAFSASDLFRTVLSATSSPDASA
jgi:hypothetical protein